MGELDAIPRLGGLVQRLAEGAAELRPIAPESENVLLAGGLGSGIFVDLVFESEGAAARTVIVRAVFGRGRGAIEGAMLAVNMHMNARKPTLERRHGCIRVPKDAGFHCLLVLPGSVQDQASPQLR